MSENGETKLRLRGLDKSFGADPLSVLPLVEKGIGKDELLEQHGHVLGLRDIDIAMKAGQITVIMGLSGSGKSTLIRRLDRLLEPTAGEILVDGEDVMSFGEDAVRRLRGDRMSMVFQKFTLMPQRPLLENAGLAQAVRGACRGREEGGLSARSCRAAG